MPADGQRTAVCFRWAALKTPDVSINIRCEIPFIKPFEDKEENITDVVKSLVYDTSQTEVTIVFYCNLFSDIVTENLCLLRRRELSSTGVFFCEACDRKEGRTLLRDCQKDVMIANHGMTDPDHAPGAARTFNAR
jgi:hypothetical protein